MTQVKRTVLEAFMGKKSKIPTDGGSALSNPAFSGINVGNAAKPLSPKRTEAQPSEAPASGDRGPRTRIEMRREKAGRGGKTVTTLAGFPTHMSFQSVGRLAQELKQQCGCGGTSRGREIELQGDVRDRVEPILQQRGFVAVRAGG
jgi:translation initiation factor 1